MDEANAWMAFDKTAAGAAASLAWEQVNAAATALVLDHVAVAASLALHQASKAAAASIAQEHIAALTSSQDNAGASLASVAAGYHVDSGVCCSSHHNNLDTCFLDPSGMAPKASALLTMVAMLASTSALSVSGGLAGAGVAGFLGWAFQGVGPSPEAKQLVAAKPPTKVKSGLMFGGTVPIIALYCGAKIRRESYAPLADAVLQKLEATPDAGVLILQSPGNIYAFKPASVAKVLEQHPSVTCIAGHSIGGLWAAEFCKDLESAGQWPASGLDFFYMGVHGRGVSLKPFKQLPFRKVGWSYASEDCTMLRAAEGNVPAYVARQCAQVTARM